MRRLQERAAEMGHPRAADFFDCTPREVALMLRSHAAAGKQQLSLLHTQARLAALAVHAPGRLPPLPSLPGSPMTPEEMKQRLLAWRREDQS